MDVQWRQSQSVWELDPYPQFLDPKQAINLAQDWGHGYPAGTVHIDLLNITSSSSSFEVRTFDPEGVLLFGDSRGGHDWFLLGLRGGRPEIHIHNQMAKVSVSGGPTVNDGEWHKIVVRSQEHRIVLEVDDQESLRIGHVSEGVTSSLDTTMRIAVGGILTNSSELMEPLHIPLDACVRSWVFLSVTPKWLLDPIFLPHSKRCFASHRKGSYFPGSGNVAYRTSDLPTASAQTGEPWTLSLQMDLHLESLSFSLLSVSHPETGTILLLWGQDKNLFVELGNDTVVTQALADVGGSDGYKFHLSITPKSVTLQCGNEKEIADISEGHYSALKHSWTDKEGIVYIGGAPTSQEESPGHFRGCLENIRIQGRLMDLDSAWYKSNSVWSHSCPPKLLPITRPSS
ncbi:sex hormone binding globulin S homeolog isoform X1 [Xenopus laevis]|uniref:Sex hormone-binding globulin n=1 Tax=Xenopus laevis TaxID=8355 RepID=A0A8J1MRG5_XENLA|nr:sex hormone binding globulin S homeolog isoform X1 [Xenopus laevis]